MGETPPFHPWLPGADGARIPAFIPWAAVTSWTRRIFPPPLPMRSRPN